MSIYGSIRARCGRQRRAPVLRVLVALSLAVAFAPPLHAAAAELLVFDDAHCAPCLQFAREIGPVYPKTDEGRRAPLRHLAHDAPLPAAYASIGTVRATPTFVLVEDGREVGRFEGYGGDELFWMRLAVEMQKLRAR